MSRNNVYSGEQIEEVSFASSLHVILVTSSWFNIHFFYFWNEIFSVMPLENFLQKCSMG